jgi:hypothetical protein
MMAERLSELVRLVWDKMRLAGEAGSLLKIEEGLLQEDKAMNWQDRISVEYRVRTGRRRLGRGGRWSLLGVVRK